MNRTCVLLLVFSRQNLWPQFFNLANRKTNKKKTSLGCYNKYIKKSLIGCIKNINITKTREANKLLQNAFEKKKKKMKFFNMFSMVFCVIATIRKTNSVFNFCEPPGSSRFLHTLEFFWLIWYRVRVLILRHSLGKSLKFLQ